jgi:hypothetical protein
MDQENSTRSALIKSFNQVRQTSSLVQDIRLVVLVQGKQDVTVDDSSQLFGVEA